MAVKLHDFDFAKWDTFLAEIEGETVKWNSGIGVEEYPVYDPRMYALAKEFEPSDFFDQSFQRTLFQKKHEAITEEEVDEISRSSADFFDVRAITSIVIYNERHMKGMWAAMTEKGILRRLLQRLHNLTPAEFPIF